MTNHKVLTIFAWSIVLCGASRWRISGVGVGETMLTFACIARVLNRRKSVDRIAHLPAWMSIVVVSSIAMLVGTVWAKAIGVWRFDDFIHDAFALVFCFGSMTLLLPLLADADSLSDFFRQFLLASVFFASVNLLVFAFLHLFLNETTQWIGRFNGLSANPNQLALYVCLTPFWLLQYPKAISFITRWIGVGSCLAVGWLCGSDALLMAWIVGFAWLALRQMRRRVRRSDPVQQAYSRLLFGLLALLVFLVSVGFLWPRIAEIYAIGGQGDLRIQRWQHGLTAFASSPLFGLGPGAFSGDEAPFDGQEAHNLYIDWLASGGLLAGTALLLLQRQTWLALWSARTDALLAGFASLLIFSCFHYVARHPIFWLHHLLFLFERSSKTVTPSPCVASSAP